MTLSHNQLQKYILEYLSKNRRVTLATSEDNVPWAATVMFAYDPDLNFYFISVPDSRKTKNIATNPKVSCAVNEYTLRAGYTIGLQIEGKAIMLNKERDRRELEIFRKRFDWADDFLHDHELYKIVPEKIYYLDDEKFGQGGREELILG